MSTNINPDKMNELKELRKLKKITDEEYEVRRNALLYPNSLDSTLVFDSYESKAAKKIVTIIISVVVLLGITVCVILGTLYSDKNGISNNSKNPYSALDKLQNQKCSYIEELMQKTLKESDLYVISGTANWIGYSHYQNIYTVEQFNEMQTGGYYSYNGELPNGSIVSARIFTYADDKSDIKILDLSTLTSTEKMTIIAYDESKLEECWNTYAEQSKLIR